MTNSKRYIPDLKSDTLRLELLGKLDEFKTQCKETWDNLSQEEKKEYSLNVYYPLKANFTNR